jgi:hypothetical protein
MASSLAITHNTTPTQPSRRLNVREREWTVVQLNARESQARIPFTSVETSKQKSTHSSTQWGEIMGAMLPWSRNGA